MSPKDATMLKNVFRANSPRGLTFSVRTLLGTMSDTSLAGLEARHKELTDKVTEILGRPPSESEMREGIRKPEPTREQISEDRKLKASAAYAERIASEALHDPTAERLKTAQERAEQERRGKLTHAERELEDATREAQAEKQRREDQQRRAEVKACAAYLTLRVGIDDALLVAKLDASVSQEAVDALTAQSEALERTADVTTVRSNLATIQKAIAEQTAIQDSELQQAVSRAELRKRMLASGATFDSVDTELVGSLPFVVLSVGDKTVKVSQERYDSRKSDESLRSELFGESEATNA